MAGPLAAIEAAKNAPQGQRLETAFRTVFPGRRRTLGVGSTTEQVTNYYHEAQTYLTGPLQGTCHFGYTEVGEQFNLPKALRAMEAQLANALDLPEGSTVVDAGCGYGRVATEMAGNYGLNVVGIDLMEERLTEAQRFVEEHGVQDNVRLIQGDYTRIPIPDASVDGFYTMETACHADPLEALLGEAWRVLKPGGKLVMFEYSAPPPESLGRFRRRITDTMIRNTGMASMGRFVHGGFPTLLEASGFENVQVKDATQNVIPTWRFLFWEAIRHSNFRILPMILQRRLMEVPNLAGSLMIYPYRHQLGYNIITATKPGGPSRAELN